MKRLLLFVLLLFTGLTYGSSILFTGSGGGGITKYANFAALPVTCADGDVAVTIDTGIIYVCESNVWMPSAGPGAPLSLGTFDGNTVDAKGASIAANVLYMQSADATHPGEVNVSTQTFAGAKTFSTSVASPLFNVSGAGVCSVKLPGAGATTYNFNLPDTAGTSGYFLTSGGGVSAPMTWTDPSTLALSLAAFGSTPNANGLTLTTNVLNMEPADATHPGGVSIAAQTFGGSKTFAAATSIAPGSVSLPGLYLSTDTTTGIYRPGVDQFNIGVSGAAVANFGTSGLAVTGLFTATSTVQGTRLISTIATGTAPLTVSSTTRVSNLNVDTSGQADTVATTQVSNNASYFPLMVSSSTNSNQAPDLGTGLTFNPSTNTMSTTTFVGALTGTASGNTTYTANNHGVVVSGSGNAMTVIAPNASTAFPLVSGGASADPAWALLGVAGGGTGLASGTSGGILGYTASGTLASSGALTQHAIVLGGGAGATPGVLASLGTTSTVLHGNASGDPSYGAIVNADITNSTIDLTAKVTGALPIANGGTGQTTKAPAFDALSPMTTGGDLIYGGSSGTGTRLANGSAGQYLKSAGGTSAPTWGSFTASTTQTFPSGSGTYTTPPGVLYIRIRMVGGGGGGAGSGSSPGAATAGGDTTFSTLTAGKGGAASALATIGTGGSASGGNVANIVGGAGCYGTNLVNGNGGNGGNSAFGTAGSGGYAANAGTNAQVNSGSGGGGAGGGASTNGTSGGGSGGYIEHKISPTAGQTFTYGVGAKGVGGTLGTGGSAGGDGGSGLIIVDEFYE